jgi:asparagine synthase (glutamine-hydrolysing)
MPPPPIRGMSQLAGLVSKRGEDVTQRLLDVLASPIDHDAYGLATPSGVEHSHHRLEFTSVTGAEAISHRLIKVQPTDNPQPIHDGDRAIAFLGRLWDTPEPGTFVAAETLRGGTMDGLSALLTDHEGAWAAAVVETGAIHLARDAIGAIPLYYGENTDFISVSTDTKTLLRLGMEPHRARPGHIVTLKAGETCDNEIASLREPPQISMSLDDAVSELDRLLTYAASRTSLGLHSPTLAFSGGIDSTLIAHYLKAAGSNPKLVCVGSEYSPDLASAETAAEALALPLSLKIITEDELDAHLDTILLSVEEPDPMKVSIAAPLYFVARDAATRPCRTIFSGNGSDEIFGGYAKYAEEYQISGESVRATMFRDVARSHEVNLERDWKVCSDLGLELRLPYIDPSLVQFTLGLPLDHKLPRNGREPRKIVLRHLAKRRGIPIEVAEKPKKAAQYSSGMSKMIERLAKSRGKNIKGYLAGRLWEAMRHE